MKFAEKIHPVGWNKISPFQGHISIFMVTQAPKTGPIWSFPLIRRRIHGGNSLKFGMQMYLDHFQNWLDFGHSLLIFQSFVLPALLVAKRCCSIRSLDLLVLSDPSPWWSCWTTYPGMQCWQWLCPLNLDSWEAFWIDNDFWFKVNYVVPW